MMETPSLFGSQEPAHGGDDIGYVLGWFCGGIGILALVMAVVFLVQGSPRKAFQAMALTVAEIAWMLAMIGLGSASRAAEEIAGAGILAGLAFLPILGVYVLRKLSWPPTKKAAS
jgi:hypothetical protein